MLLMRAGTDAERSEDYVFTARAKGLRERDVRDRHVARNAIAPVLAGSFLALISLARKAGFSLDEIGDMFTPDGPDIDRALLLAKADELDRKIRELTTMRDGLRHAAACRAPSHFECPKFLRILRIAGKNRTREPNKLKKETVKRR